LLFIPGVNAIMSTAWLTVSITRENLFLVRGTDVSISDRCIIATMAIFAGVILYVVITIG